MPSPSHPRTRRTRGRWTARLAVVTLGTAFFANLPALAYLPHLV